jgi:hypothetical protein
MRQEYCLQLGIGLLGYPIPPRRSSFPTRPRGVPVAAVPRNSRPGIILSRALLPSRVSRAAVRPAEPGTSHGLPFPLRDVTRRSPLTRASPARFVPSSAFLTPPTVCSSTDLAGLFHPAATSRVRSSGSSPREKPCGLIARRCPHVVCAAPLLPVARQRRNTSPAFRAFLHSRVR